MILDSTGVDIDLKFYVRALYDWVQQEDIVNAITQAGRATPVELMELYVVLNATKDDLGKAGDTEWWEKYEGKIMLTLYAFVMDRNVRRLIAKRMSKRMGGGKDDQGMVMKQLEELKKTLGARLES